MLFRTLLCLMLALATVRAEEEPAAKPAYPVQVPDILAHFFQILQEGKTSYAAEWLCGSNPLMTDKPELIVKLKYVLGEFTQHCGAFSGFDAVLDKKVGTHVEYIAGLGIYKTQPAAFAFTFYNSGDGWMLQNFDLTLNVDDRIRQFVFPASVEAPAATPPPAPAPAKPAPAPAPAALQPTVPPMDLLPAPSSPSNSLPAPDLETP